MSLLLSPGGNHFEQTVTQPSCPTCSLLKIKATQRLSQCKCDNQATIYGGVSTGLLWMSLYGWFWCLTSADWTAHLVPVVTLPPLASEQQN